LFTKGEVNSTNTALAKATLRKQGINPLNIKKKPKPLFGGNTGKKITAKDIAIFARQLATMMNTGKKITAKDIAIFARQLATMMSSGLTLVQSFENIAEGAENPRMQELVTSVKISIEGGSTLAEGLAKHPLQFDDLFCNLVAAGEAAGALETLLEKIATYKEKIEAIKGKIKKAMFYPTAIMAVAFLITAILMIFVIPQFGELFGSFGADLPAMTQMVMDMSDFFVAYWWAIFGGIGGGIYGMMQLKRRSRPFNRALDRILLKVPVLGPIMKKSIIARYARTLATMFAAGMPLVDSLDTVARSVGNVMYEAKILTMRDEVSGGQQLNVSMKAADVFPSMVVQMVGIGEETGAVDAMLAKVADFYEEEVDNAVDGMTALLEPLIMAILGVLIGGLVIAMYLPIFKMGSVVGGH
jgi:type IV pilus assembly protein PilC